jgi:hypothetical protein
MRGYLIDAVVVRLGPPFPPAPNRSQVIGAQFLLPPLDRLLELRHPGFRLFAIPDYLRVLAT